MKKATTKSKKTQAGAKNAPVVDVTRRIKDFDRLLLFVRAGGRCEFDGCNKYLLEHHLTLTEGNFAQMAHIVAFSQDGPRGNFARPASINDVNNLMALCPECHKLIDDEPLKFTTETLIGYKEQHERRVKHVTGLGPEQKTSIVVVKSKIGQQTVAFPFDHILEAVTPRYPLSREGLSIDLTQLPAESASFVGAACDTIRTDLRVFFGSGGEFQKAGHISLFALAPIPILAFLGNQFSNKVALDVYQRHRDKENWTWKKNGVPVRYEFRQVQKGSDSQSVAFILSLSGAIDLAKLPADIDKRFSIYEMMLANVIPNPTFLNTKADLEEFRTAYQLAIGREILLKVHPELRIYDNNKRHGGFTYQLTINQI